MTRYKNERWLRERYHDDGMTLEQIGEVCGVGDTTILNWMERFDIPRREPSHMSKSMEDRFWEKVDQSGDCWEWTAATDEFGYGNFWTGGAYERAHRVAFRICKGEVGDNLVLHHCDNPPCVNPDHLYLGDHADNSADQWQRNPIDRSGENSPRAILSREDVAEIKSRLGDDTQEELAEEFGVSRGAVSHIALGLNWGDV